VGRKYEHVEHFAHSRINTAIDSGMVLLDSRTPAASLEKQFGPGRSVSARSKTSEHRTCMQSVLN